MSWIILVLVSIIAALLLFKANLNLEWLHRQTYGKSKELNKLRIELNNKSGVIENSENKSVELLKTQEPLEKEKLAEKKMWLVNEDLYIVKKSLDEEMNIFDLNYNVL